MKKLLSFFTVLILLTMLTATTNAQNKMGVSVQAGVAFPTGDFGDGAGTGFGATGTFLYDVSPMFQVTGSVGYAKWGPKEDLPSGYDYSLSTVPVLVGGRYSFGKDNFMPYVLAELGVHFLSSTVESPFGKFSDSSTKFGFAPGVGFVYKFNPKVGLDVNVKYDLISTEGSSTTYVGVNAGVLFAL
jgi:opacity protein-like surface antigen